MEARGSLRFCWFVAAISGCGTDIAQTAVYRKAEVIDCSVPEVAPVLPTLAEWGSLSRATNSPLVSPGYEAGNGPGILVASRDAFRLYVNGELLEESTDSLSPRFVGYSFLPGENVVSIVATARDRAPLVSVLIDELERSHVSDVTWKVSSVPAVGWTSADFDDSGWMTAVDFGATAAEGNCAKTVSAFEGSGARYVGAPDPATTTLALRYRLVIVPSGFGEATTGGESGSIVAVSDYAALREALEDNDTPRVVVIPEMSMDVRPPVDERKSQSVCPTACETSSVTQYIALPSGSECATNQVSIQRNERKIYVGSNKTIVGLGRGARLRGAWLDLTDSSNIVLRNLTLFDVNPGLIEAGDGLSLSHTTGLWVDHCTFKWISDGFADVNDNSTAVTFSWARFDGQNDAECRGSHLRSTEVIDSEATFHHCMWQAVDGRAPFVHGSMARVHLYNNVVADALDYAVGSGCLGQVLLEGSYFLNVAVPTSRRDCVETPDLFGLIQAAGRFNVYGTGVQSHLYDGVRAEEPADNVFVPSYAYELDPTSEIQFEVPERAGAGSRWALPLAKD